MNAKLPKGTLEKLWSDPAHWRGPFYFCKSDPRKVVPKRVRWTGWTINFAHPSARVGLLASLVILALTCAALLYLKNSGHEMWMYALIGVSIVYTWWDSRRRSAPIQYEESA